MLDPSAVQSDTFRRMHPAQPIDGLTESGRAESGGVPRSGSSVTSRPGRPAAARSFAERCDEPRLSKFSYPEAVIGPHTGAALEVLSLHVSANGGDLIMRRPGSEIDSILAIGSCRPARSRTKSRYLPGGAVHPAVWEFVGRFFSRAGFRRRVSGGVSDTRGGQSDRRRLGRRMALWSGVKDRAPAAANVNPPQGAGTQSRERDRGTPALERCGVE